MPPGNGCRMPDHRGTGPDLMSEPGSAGHETNCCRSATFDRVGQAMDASCRPEKRSSHKSSSGSVNLNSHVGEGWKPGQLLPVELGVPLPASCDGDDGPEVSRAEPPDMEVGQSIAVLTERLDGRPR